MNLKESFESPTLILRSHGGEISAWPHALVVMLHLKARTPILPIAGWLRTQHPLPRVYSAVHLGPQQRDSGFSAVEEAWLSLSVTVPRVHSNPFTGELPKFDQCLKLALCSSRIRTVLVIPK